MSLAFVLYNETILCRQTPNGWLPLQVQLPNSDVDSEQAYQIGRVALFDSLAPDSWLLDDDIKKTNNANSITVPASCAITYEYAIANSIVLPDILDSSSLENSNLQSSHSDSESPIANGTTFVPYRQLITQLPSALSSQLSQAIQLLRWQADTQFCSRCAAPVIHAKADERAMVCQACRLRQYPRVQPCVITAITRPNPHTGETQILLAHHHRYGQQTTAQQALQYGLIAGFVEVGESLEHAVVREVAEEVGISLSDIRYVSSQPWPFPSNLMLGFRASYAGGDIVIQEDELSHADFFDLSKLPKIPFTGSIAYELIEQIANEQGVTL